MIKNNKVKFIISSIILLVPMLVALIVHNFVKPLMHGFFGVFIVFPLITLALHIFCLWLSEKIGNIENQNKKIINMTFWIVPMINLYVAAVMLCLALGVDFKLPMLVAPILGVMFIVMGNYMPKAVQNRTFGIKITWTLANEENWNATHRFAGKLWVGMGALMLLSAFLSEIAFIIAFIVILTVAIVACSIYSFVYYKRMLREGRCEKATVASVITETDKKAFWISIVSVLLVITFAVILMVSGKVNFAFDEDSLNIKATFGGKMDIAYSEIESIEYREGKVEGTRVGGFGSAKLLYGIFRNDEFGTYTRYTYTASDSAVILIVDSEEIVIADATTEATRAIYDRLMLECGR